MKNQVTNASTLTMLGTLTALAATSQAAVVQITLSGNQISTGFGNSLNADVTGDGMDDLVLSNSTAFSLGDVASAVVRANNDQLSAFRSVTSSYSGSLFRLDAQFAAGGVGTANAAGSYPGSISYLNPITFTDARINGGAATNGWLEVKAFRNSITDQNIVFSRVIFDDASTSRPSFATVPGAQTPWSAVPEPSSLALLALGAGGLLVRRRRQVA